MTTKSVFRREAGFLATSAVFGVLIGLLVVAVRHRAGDWTVWANGASIGLAITLLCAVSDITVFHSLAQRSFARNVAVRTAVHATFAAVVVLGGRLLTKPLADLAADPYGLLITVLVTIAISYMVNVFLGIRRVLGRNVLRSLLVGRYSSPLEEIRMFMFVDLVESTTVAERIGHVRYHQLVHSFMCDVSDAIAEARGDIYKYVGDEVIVTWLLDEAKLGNHWLDCYFQMRDCIKEKEDQYRRAFGVVPAFRTSLHCGMVVAGEMGDWKREVGFMGDAINTTSRMLDVCKSSDRDFVVSEAALQRVADRTKYVIEAIPEAALRGRTSPLPLFGVAQPGG